VVEPRKVKVQTGEFVGALPDLPADLEEVREALKPRKRIVRKKRTGKG
jgi:hypothetical protein